MASEELQPLQGMADIGPPEIRRWQELEQTARKILELYGFEEVRTPLLERAELFVRSLGNETDVVQKEMYAFTDRGGRALALRPEGTAGVLRYVASRGPEAAEARMYYVGPMFRAERPQAGRRRQFHQLGAEAIGPPNPAADVELIALQAHLLQAWGLEKWRIRVNSRGTAEDISMARRRLRECLEPLRDTLCDDCRRRLETNVLRVLDCKQPSCRAHVERLPPLSEWLAPASRAYLEDVLQLAARLELPLEPAPHLIRGLDYYLHTVWEITHEGLGAQDAIAGGGRYRIEVGGRAVEGVGFAIGLERVLMALAGERGGAGTGPSRQLVWLVAHGEDARHENLRLLQILRRHGVAVRMCLDDRSVKAQLRAADRAGATHAVIRGEMELAKGVFVVKDLRTGNQQELSLPELIPLVTSSSPLALDAKS